MIFTAVQDKAIKILTGIATRILLYGGSRSGKSVIAARFIRARFYNFPGCRQLVLRKTQRDCKLTFWRQTLIPMFRIAHREGIVKIYQNEGRIVNLMTGSEIIIGGMRPDQIEKHLGGEYATILIEEASEVDEQSVNLISTRLNALEVNEKGAIIVPKLILTENPPPKVHWTYEQFFNRTKFHAAGKKRRTMSHKEFQKYAHIQINPYDNRANLSPDYIESLESLPEGMRLRFLKGEFGSLEGLIFHNFNPARHVRQLNPDRLRGSRYRSIDFGYENPFCCLWANIDTTGHVTVYREWYRSHMTIEKHAEKINQLTGDEEIEGTCADHDKGNRMYIEEHFGIESVPAQKNKQASIEILRSLLERNKITIDAECTNLINEMYAYRLKDKAKDDADVVKKDDHAIDALLYLLFTFLSEGKALEAGEW